MHLFMNLFGLGMTSASLEKILKPRGLILSFLFCGVMASIVSTSWNDNVTSVGASGAIFGLAGMILAFDLTNVFPKHISRFMTVMIVIYGGISLLFGLLGGIDNSAHIGGLIAGLLLGVLLSMTNGEQLRANAKDF